jgi:drug/metabolite transporter (DMT)-like permease
MNNQLITVLSGLGSSIGWGTADFCGGVASKKTPPMTVVVISQSFGLAVLVMLGLVLNPDPPETIELVVGAIAGLAGATGLVFFYQGLASGQMGVVAPVGAVVTATMPLIYGSLTEGVPGSVQITGFAIALLGIWLVSTGEGIASFRLRNLRLPVFAGLFFGLFFILIGEISDDAIIWPLIAARTATIPVMLLVAVLMREFQVPSLRQVPLMAAAGLMDIAGNTFFALAARFGRLDVASVLASLYPATTVVLAMFFLKEQVAWKQWFGIVVCLVAVVLIQQ